MKGNATNNSGDGLMAVVAYKIWQWLFHKWRNKDAIKNGGIVVGQTGMSTCSLINVDKDGNHHEILIGQTRHGMNQESTEGHKAINIIEHQSYFTHHLIIGQTGRGSPFAQFINEGNIETEKEFWNKAQHRVIEAIAKADREGLKQALAQRTLIAWLLDGVEKLNPLTNGMDWKIIEPTKIDLQMIKDSDAEAIAFYDALDSLGDINDVMQMINTRLDNVSSCYLKPNKGIRICP